MGKINGTIDFRKGAGYLGLGVGGRGRIGLIMDLGVMMQGTPQVTYTATVSGSGATPRKPVRLPVETGEERPASRS